MRFLILDLEGILELFHHTSIGMDIKVLAVIKI